MVKKTFNIVVEGCCHGELDAIYSAIAELNKPVDLVLICGDFQALRNEQDMNCIAMPPKYRKLGDFYKYYTGEKKAPYLTLFIGGNHEASNYLWELFYGGWVAPNIYYMGAAGVVNFNGLKIGGLSGIYNSQHFHWHHLERLPYNGSSERSVYHVRKFDAMKLLLLRQGLDVMMSHDWPARIEHFGDLRRLLKIKKHLAKDVDSGRLGSPAAGSILEKVKPHYWFSAHLHVRYEALVKHGESSDSGAEKKIEDPEKDKNDDEIDLGELLIENETDSMEEIEKTKKEDIANDDEIDLSEELSVETSNETSNVSEGGDILTQQNGSSETKFLALDKCIRGRHFIEHVSISIDSPLSAKRKRQPSTESIENEAANSSSTLSYDPEWLAITRALHKYFKTSPKHNVDELNIGEIDTLKDSISKELDWVNENIVNKNLLAIPHNFQVLTETPANTSTAWAKTQPPEIKNNQTDEFCQLLQIDNRIYRS